MLNNNGLFTKRHMRTYVFSPENPTGMPGCGSKGEDWQKLHPCDVLEAGEVKTLVDTDARALSEACGLPVMSAKAWCCVSIGTDRIILPWKRPWVLSLVMVFQTSPRTGIIASPLSTRPCFWPLPAGG